MSDHLPECVCYTKGHAHKCALCICDRLRACEARVQEQVVADLDMGLFLLGKREGYAAGVQAARDAVAALLRSWGRVTDPEAEDMIFAAIDALKKESDD